MPAASRTAAALGVAAVSIVLVPMLVSDFVLLQIVIKSLWLGIVGAGLAFLIGQAGILSLAQTAVFGASGYVMAILVLDHGWGTWWAVVAALAAGPVAGLIVGVISRRSSGLYLMMLTLAIGVFVFFFAQQYQPITRGHTGFNGFDAPMLFGWDLNERRPLFYATAVAALAVTALLRYVARTPAGLAFRGLRDNRHRLQALGYSAETTVVSAFVVAGAAAGLGGVISVWYNGAISPGSIDLTRTIELLIVVVIGGTLRFEGAFLGALAVTLLRNYASDFTNRAETLVGVAFMAVVLLTRHGLTGVLIGFLSRVRHALRLVRGQRPAPDQEMAGRPVGRPGP
ncbi:MAG: branched-chain amino acid ABC transporter permease [Acidimicrobiales bacterium]|nr:branched-chain amino acid ABC transporter permease [Acidimicrobiaceae bacterium]MXV88521.1 branched-chain amino acid ABC transporter permease [Acidimicrobiales bacterium]MCY3608264.1 branched-chain amino acid ABC transporter permease [Acidimicrobiaceae bacterium]MDE0676717.1 branched-chain amino acid ABC transporter permease [Acidimicrobiaceae bacterium]MXX41549.1 branched-chain amino acid ABC transporter permease [Acidimicrobiales bacterium]